MNRNERTGTGGSPAPLSTDERARLTAIAELGLLQEDLDELLSDLAQEAAAALGLPMSVISFVLDDAQHFAATHGITGWLGAAGGTPIEWAFCRFPVETRAAFVVEDTEQHAAGINNPLVTHGGVRCYAGVPLIASSGYAIGTLCVVGTEPRAFGTNELKVLENLAAESIARIESRGRR